MRIDLHMHTQKCKKGDGSKRNITPENLIAKLSEQNVKICAVTNHNKFDQAEYEKIRELNPDLTIFPGIELDIDFHEERRHVVVISNPKKIKEFSGAFDDEGKRDYNEFSLSFEDFTEKVKLFNTEDIIIIPHFMDKDRGFTLEERQELFSGLEGFIVILETSKLRSMGVVNDHEEHLSLIGSDVKDWASYSAENLPELKFYIDSFEKFYELASDAKNFVKNALMGAEQYSLNVNGADIPIFNDINVLFGEKGSGKTVLLKDHIYPYFVDAGKQVFLHEGREYPKLYQSMIKGHADSVILNEADYLTIADGFDKITEYNEPNTPDFFKNYRDYREDKTTNKKSQRIHKSAATFSNNAAITTEAVIREASVRILKIEEVKTINNSVRTSPGSLVDKERLEKELHKLSLEIRARAASKHRELLSAHLTETFLSSLKESLQKKTQMKSKPNNIGFSKLVAKRALRLKTNAEIKYALQHIQASEEISLGNLPSKGNVKFETSVVCLTEEDLYKKDSIFDKSKIVANRKLIKKINNFSINNFSQVNQYFSATEKEVAGHEFADDVVKKSSLIKIKGNDDYVPSEGEKAILSISGVLESYSYECYLFDEVESGLGNKYISDYLIPRLKSLRSKGKTVILSTHNANIAVNTLPSQVVYCNYPSENTYYVGNMYSNELAGVVNGEVVSWEEKAVIHLEGNKEMFNKRKNIYGF